MIAILRKTSDRTTRFLSEALTLRASYREHAAVAWGLVLGALWLSVSLTSRAVWLNEMLFALYLLAVLAAVCAIDARFGIIPNSFVIALAAGGLIWAYYEGPTELLERLIEATAVTVAVALFRACYRWIRRLDGLGLGDVKFLGAAAFWVGLQGIPVLLLVAVLSALISVLVLRLEGNELHGQQAISFGPHLAVGLWLTWIAGPVFLGLDLI